MKKLFIACVLGFAVITVKSQTTWKVDPSHSTLGFSVSHLVISEVEGKFKVYEGTINSKKDDFAGSDIYFTVDVKSIDTENEKRDEHLLSDDFFNAEKFPKMTFKSVSFKKLSGNKYVLEGDLTIRDVTKRVKFDVTYNGQTKSPWGQTVAGFKASSVINRQDFGLKWNKALETGGFVVGDSVNIHLKLEFIKQ
jgi:polyisoprenoid-binding protein YceI